MKAKTIVAVVITALLFFSTAIADKHGIAWQDLSDGQRIVLSQFAGSWDALPADKQMRLSRGAERWETMNPE